MSQECHVPVRMCIGCRRKRRKDEMLQFIKGADGVVFVNKKKATNGRGFYLCPDPLCFKKAQQRERWIGSLASMFPLQERLK